MIPSPHRLMMTKGVACLAEDKLLQLFKSFREFEKFEPGNDPYGERDFIALEVGGEKYFLKMDYFDDSFMYFREDGNRVITIMQANEYY